MRVSLRLILLVKIVYFFPAAFSMPNPIATPSPRGSAAPVNRFGAPLASYSIVSPCALPRLRMRNRRGVAPGTIQRPLEGHSRFRTSGGAAAGKRSSKLLLIPMGGYAALHHKLIAAAPLAQRHT